MVMGKSKVWILKERAQRRLTKVLSKKRIFVKRNDLYRRIVYTNHKIYTKNRFVFFSNSLSPVLGRNLFRHKFCYQFSVSSQFLCITYICIHSFLKKKLNLILPLTIIASLHFKFFQLRFLFPLSRDILYLNT